jgi:hypothetical protein
VEKSWRNDCAEEAVKSMNCPSSSYIRKAQGKGSLVADPRKSIARHDGFAVATVVHDNTWIY